MPSPTANKFSSSTAIFDLLKGIEAGQVLTVQRVRDRLAVSERQARDYLAFLECRGRVQRVRRGRVLEFHRPATGHARGGLGRAVGTAYAIAAMGALEGTVFHEEVSEWLNAEASGLEERTSQELGRLRHAFHPVAASTALNPRCAEHAETAIEAIRRGRRLKGVYERLSDGEVISYRLRPQALVLHRDGLRLLARKADGKLRMFDIEGFRSLALQKGPGAEPEGDPARFFEHAFGRYIGFPATRSLLRVHGTAAQQVRRRLFHGTQRIESDDGQSLLVGFEVGLCPDYEAWLLSLVPDIEVLEPPDLGERIQDKLDAGLRRITASTS